MHVRAWGLTCARRSVYRAAAVACIYIESSPGRTCRRRSGLSFSLWRRMHVKRGGGSQRSALATNTLLSYTSRTREKVQRAGVRGAARKDMRVWSVLSSLLKIMHVRNEREPPQVQEKPYPIMKIKGSVAFGEIDALSLSRRLSTYRYTVMSFWLDWLVGKQSVARK